MNDFPILESVLTCANISLAYFAWKANDVSGKARKDAQVALAISQK